MSRRRSRSGLTTIEMVIVFAIFGLVLVGLLGLHLIAISAGTVAETSSVATNLGRARMEEMLSLPPDQIQRQGNTEIRRQIPAQEGRTYTVRTLVTSLDRRRLDIAVTVTWQVAFAGSCASAGSGTACPGSTMTYSRTLQTRVQTPSPP